MELRQSSGNAGGMLAHAGHTAANIPGVDPRWKRLADAIDTDRKLMRLSWTRLAKSAGMSPRTLFDLRNADRTSYQPETLDRLELALHWEPGSVERVLIGRAPRRKSDPDMARLQQAWPDLPPSVRRVLADVAEHYRP